MKVSINLDSVAHLAQFGIGIYAARSNRHGAPVSLDEALLLGSAVVAKTMASYVKMKFIHGLINIAIRDQPLYVQRVYQRTIQKMETNKIPILAKDALESTKWIALGYFAESLIP